MSAWIKMPLGMELGLSPGDFVLDGDPLYLHKKGQSPLPNFWPTSVVAGCIKMPLAMEVGLSLGDFVLDGDPVPPPKKGAKPPSPIFCPYLLWPNGWLDQHGTWRAGALVQATLW